MKNSENWHKKHCSAGNVDTVKELLEKETETVPYTATVCGKVINTVKKQVTPIPILHNKGKIYLQFCGWSINLLDDGTWHWEDTTGG